MTTRKTPLTDEQRAKILAELRRDVALRQASYRERALKLFPHLCARCGREFEGRRLRELTVHHKDHNHDNNPPDGSNWELLCLYCHDHEHEKYLMAGHGDGGSPAEKLSPSIFSPLANLDALLKQKNEPK
jgi:5-methylcytosine-specific restriction endonuclease McrA